MSSKSPREVLRTAESQWLFTVDDFSRTPSALDGMPLRKERENRGKAVHFITQVGIMLKLPQTTLSTANLYMQRFFMRYSMVDKPGQPAFHYYAIAATALFLATKVEENGRKMKELVAACCRTAQKNPNLIVDEQSKEYWRWRDTILHNEDLLLEALCFDLSHEAPYKTLFDFLNDLGEQHNKVLRNAGWMFLNDSSTTMLCLLYPSRVIAAAALYCAARHHGFAFPDHDGLAWWEVLQVPLLDIKRACNYMATIYNDGGVKAPPENMYAWTPEDDDPVQAKTRHPTRFTASAASPSPHADVSSQRSEDGPSGPSVAGRATTPPRSTSKRPRDHESDGPAGKRVQGSPSPDHRSPIGDGPRSRDGRSRSTERPHGMVEGEGDVTRANGDSRPPTNVSVVPLGHERAVRTGTVEDGSTHRASPSAPWGVASPSENGAVKPAGPEPDAAELSEEGEVES